MDVFSWSKFEFMRLGVCLPLLSLCNLIGEATSSLAADIEYSRDIRPILADKCFACHGPDAKGRQGDLRLDVRSDAIDAQAIVAGKPDESELMRRIVSTDPDEVMPPPETSKALTEPEKDLLKRWIETGAEYQIHWSFESPKRSSLPTVRQSDWPRNSIDRFVLAKLETIGLEPNPEADLRTLVRRACLDVTGLPPTIEEIEAVLNDRHVDRYERYVDSLLERPTWGEHRARYWMDYARYGDTHGIHFDNYREMYSYRDWVIAAFNSNMPFDQFTVEQLAGDLLPSPSLSQRIATGFNRCNITTNEGGIIDEEYAVLYARDRVETTSTVWLGLTTGCAVCHDHKFDPISQKEFYRLAAFFNNLTQPVRDGNVKDTPPIIPVPSETERDAYRVLLDDIANVDKQLSERRNAAKDDFVKWFNDKERIRNDLARHSLAEPNAAMELPLGESSSPQLIAKVDGRLQRVPLAEPTQVGDGYVGSKAWLLGSVRPAIEGVNAWERDQGFSLSFWVYLANDRSTGPVLGCVDEKQAARGWEVSLSANRIVVQLAHKSPKDAIRITSEQSLAKDRWQHVAIQYDGQSKATGVTVSVDGNAFRNKVAVDALTGTLVGNNPFRLGSRRSGDAPVGVAIQDVRLYRENLEPSRLHSLGKDSRINFLCSKAEPTDPEKEEIRNWYLEQLDESYRKLTQQKNEFVRRQKEIEARGTIAHVMAEKSTQPVAFVLNRGEYDKRGEEVQVGTPSILPPFAQDLPANRLGLARWLVKPEHPLTARVTVNRFWQEVFGNGIVPTTGDFGVSGAPPSNAELLDHLALSFIENGWNVKELFRSMLLSATYRQSAVSSPQKLSSDPNNTYFSRGPRFRLDGEMVRDYALFTSGLMSSRIGGKSAFPYQPGGVWEAVAMPNSDTKSYKEDEGEGLYRRSLYTFWKRAAPPASLEIFNAPTREVCVVKRERTNTPLQALVTLNDTQFIEAARHLAARALRSKSTTDTERLQWLAEVVLARPFNAEEMAIVQESLDRLRDHYQSNKADAESLAKVGKSESASELDVQLQATWTMIAHQLLNLDEALCK